MAQNFLACDREQEMLLPPSLRDWLAVDHLAWFVLDVIESQADLAPIYADYRADGHGRPAHEPAMMLALLIYGMAVGVRSSRALERACRQDIAFRVICANRVPDHTTINRFRSRHQDAAKHVFTEVLRLCAKSGLVQVGEIAIDGSKLAANASLRESRSYRAIRAAVDVLFEEAERLDGEEDALYGSARGDELPPELVDPRSRRARLEAARRALEAEDAARQAEWEATQKARAEHRQRTGKNPPGRPPTPPEEGRLERRKRNITDLDSRIVHHRGQLIQGYNPQLAVTAGQVIVAAAASNHERDTHQLQPMLAAARQQLDHVGVGQPIQTLLADGGYYNTAAIEHAEQTSIEVLIPPPKQSHRAPLGSRLKAKLDTPAGKARYRRRAQIVEPVFAHIRHHRGATRFLRRSLPAVDAEWQLLAATHNLLKLFTASRTQATA
jgi:transposase